MTQEKNLYLVRPSLGNALIADPAALREFTISVAGKWPATPDLAECGRPPSAREVADLVRTAGLSLGLTEGARRISLQLRGMPEDRDLKVYPRWAPLKGLDTRLYQAGLPASCAGADRLLNQLQGYGGGSGGSGGKDQKPAARAASAVTPDPALRKPLEQLPVPAFPDECHYAAGFRWECRLRVGADDAAIATLPKPAMLNLSLGNRVSRHAVQLRETLPSAKRLRFIHLTDTHLSFRNDLIPEILFPDGKADRLERWRFLSHYRNFNGNFRAVVAHANQLAARGELDLIVLSGDVVDYVYDSPWMQSGAAEASNFRAFSSIVTGQGGVEALRVPIFVLPGNHDYLPFMTPLAAKLDPDGEEGLWWLNLIPIVGPILYGYAALYRIDRNGYGAFGLSDNEKPLARKVDAHYGVPGEFGIEPGLKLLTPRFGPLCQYIEEINYDLDFVFTLGGHRFACLNTGEDIGVPTSKDEAQHPRTIHQKNYLDGSPDNRGITDHHLSCMLGSSTQPGRSFVFAHAPLANLRGQTSGRLDGPISEAVHERAPPPPNIVTGWLGWLFGKVVRISCPLRSDQREALIRYLEAEIRHGDSSQPGLPSATPQTTLARSVLTAVQGNASPERIVEAIRALRKHLSGRARHQLDAIVLDSYGRINWTRYEEAAHPGWDPPLGTLVAELRSMGYPQAGTRFFKAGPANQNLGYGVADGAALDFLREICRERQGTKPVDIVFSGHTHHAPEYRLETDPAVIGGNRWYAMDYSRQGWFQPWAPILVQSGSLKTDVPEFRYVEVTPEAVRFPMRSISGPNRPDPAGLQHLFTAASLPLARYGLCANPARNSTAPETHLDWATGTQSWIAILVDLIEKYRELFGKLERDRARLAGAYAEAALLFNRLGLDFGYPARNSTDPQDHRTWAMTAPVKVICGEIEHRAETVFRRADRTLRPNHSLLSMWFAGESIQLADRVTFNHAWRDSRDPAVHLAWAESVDSDRVVADIGDKYQNAVRILAGRAGPQNARVAVQLFYVECSARLAGWGIRPAGSVACERADDAFFLARSNTWSADQMTTDLLQRVALLARRLAA